MDFRFIVVEVVVGETPYDYLYPSQSRPEIESITDFITSDVINSLTNIPEFDNGSCVFANHTLPSRAPFEINLTNQ